MFSAAELDKDIKRLCIGKSRFPVSMVTGVSISRRFFFALRLRLGAMGRNGIWAHCASRRNGFRGALRLGIVHNYAKRHNTDTKTHNLYTKIHKNIIPIQIYTKTHNPYTKYTKTQNPYTKIHKNTESIHKNTQTHNPYTQINKSTYS